MGSVRTLIAIAAAIALSAFAGCSKSSSSTPIPVAPPQPIVIGSVTPALGPESGGTTITIAGSGFASTDTITVGGAAGTSITFVSSLQLECVTPIGTPGAADVVVSHALGGSQTLTGGFTYIAKPNPVSLSAASGPQTGSTNLTLTGTDFQNGATVTVGGVAATGVTFGGSTSLSFTTASMTPQVGPVAIVVTNPDAQTGTLNGAFSLTGPAPVVLLAAPTAGIATGGTTLYLTGRDFAPSAAVTVGGSPATVAFNSTTALTVTTPSGTAGAANIVVTNPDAQASTLTAGFTYWGSAPTITQINPASGPTGGGTLVTIDGTNFSMSPAAVVQFAGSTAAITSNTGSRIICTTPNMNAFGFPRIGPQNVAVVNPDGQGATVVGGFNATGGAVTVSGFTPGTGSANGGTKVTITGTGFDPILDGSVTTSTVAFGTVAAVSVDVRSATQIVCYAPAGSGTVSVTVTNADGTNGTSAGTFAYAAGPGVTSIAPNNGVVTGGTAVTITGLGFAAGDTVDFGGAAATSVSIASATQITCVTPAGPLQRVDVTVTPSSGPVSALPLGFSYRNGVTAQTAPYTWDTSTGIDCRNRFYLNMNQAAMLKDLQNVGLQSWNTPGDASPPPTNLPVVDQYAHDWFRAYVLRTINIVYGRNPNGTKISGKSINITFAGLPPATGAIGCGTPSTGYSVMSFGGCHPSSGTGHPIATQSCPGGVLGRAQFDNADSVPCNSYAENTSNNVYHDCQGCATHNGVFTGLIANIFNSQLPGGQLSGTDQQYLDGTTSTGTRYTQVHTHLQDYARRVAFVAAHEIGHVLGLSANGAGGPCTVTLSTGQCGATPGHNNCCTGNLMGQSISVSSAITFTDYTEGLSGNPDASNPAKGNPAVGPTARTCSNTGESSWAVLQAYLGISP